MGIFDFLRRSKPPAPKIQVANHQDFWERVTNDGFVPLARNPDVLIAVDRIADLVSSMTIHLMENTDKGDTRVRDGLARKIDVEPCRRMTRKAWLYKIVKDLLLDGDGNSVVHVSYDPVTNLIDDLQPFPMGQVSFDIKDGDYTIVFDGERYGPDEVLHFAINPDPTNYFLGTGYRAQLREIVANLSQATQTKKNFMGGRHLPNLIIKVDALSHELMNEEGRTALFDKYFANRPGQPWLVPAEMFDITQVKPLSLQDIALNESVELDKKTVAGLLGVPAFFLGVGEFNKQEYNTFVNTRVMAIAQVISQTLTRDLLVSPNRYFKLNPRSLYAYDLTELVSSGKELVALAAMRRNELRDWIGLAPDPDMDEVIVLENYLPQSQLGNQQKLKGGETNDGETTSLHGDTI